MEQSQFDDERTEMNTPSAVINKMMKKGYTEGFRAEKNGLFAPSKEKHYEPAEINVVNFYRFEGDSDPADNAILYVIETTDGLKGTLMDSYGADADRNVTLFMDQVEGIHKK
jgi:hypothetical protein